ncbi:hypothetical protein EFO53_03650 [Lacticaseibacillus rhamnosus]|nr:hypothetical protein [Lacticaseibacillus rhamnosus]MCT3156135.1 hypothetical protein [Lacticaseibacillus rhamnosus]MCT3194960.1 hypothetical protein [Lacticaseibacillus rhamnosus]PLC32386.1 hypothetical protein C0Q89_12840 [Lacticaseibacillus rhamnosus]PTR97067.1 hypothetical protein DBP95_07280 [Lacticaseibacillus rhamnosus]
MIRSAGFWPLRLRSLHVDFCAGERVSEPSTVAIGSSVTESALSAINRYVLEPLATSPSD